jgi:hypothetical protein
MFRQTFENYRETTKLIPYIVFQFQRNVKNYVNYRAAQFDAVSIQNSFDKLFNFQLSRVAFRLSNTFNIAFPMIDNKPEIFQRYAKNKRISRFSQKKQTRT